MASLEDKLTCAICLQLYQAPVTLPCGHNFCCACIQKWEPQQPQPQCPTCRTPFCGDTELCRNVEFSDVVDMVRAELDRRPGEPPFPDPVPDPDPGLELATKPAPRCPRHGWPLELFCRTEGRCVCCACTVRECHGHQRALLRTARQDREAQLKAALETQWRQQLNRTEQQLQDLKQQMQQVETSADTVTSVVSDKFSRLLQALEERRASALRDLEEARSRASAQAQEVEQRLQRHLQALAEYDSRARAVLDQEDDVAFLQKSQLLVLPAPVEPPSPPQWDEEQQAGDLKKWLSQLAGLLLEEGALQAPAEAAVSHPPDALSIQTPGPGVLCPVRRELWQNYRNLTFDPSSANRYLHLLRQDQRVVHRPKPRDQVGPDCFELWQVQCWQRFSKGRHYWEVRTSGTSVTLGVASPDLPRCRRTRSTDNIGRGPNSWGLCLLEDRTQAWHDGKVQRLPRVSGRLLGMDLDLHSNRLAFYSLEPNTQLLHTFHDVFTRPVCPVFWLLEKKSLTLLQKPEAKVSPVPVEEPPGPRLCGVDAAATLPGSPSPGTGAIGPLGEELKSLPPTEDSAGDQEEKNRS